LKQCACSGTIQQPRSRHNRESKIRWNAYKNMTHKFLNLVHWAAGHGGCTARPS
jgi:hypothetical protein